MFYVAGVVVKSVLPAPSLSCDKHSDVFDVQEELQAASAWTFEGDSVAACEKGNDQTAGINLLGNVL